MGFLDDVKAKLSGGKEGLGGKAKGVAAKLDDKAEELAARDGVVGKIAGKAHEVLDKVDGDQ